MRFHKFNVNERKRRVKSNVYHHMRRFLTVYSDDEEKELFEGHIETIVQKPKPEFSARFHVGNAGSETPFDGHLTVFGTGLYWGVSLGRKLAQKLTSSPKEPYGGRDISLRLDRSTVYLRAWTPPDRWSRGEFARWRDCSFSLNPLEWKYGPVRYFYKDMATAETVIEIAGDEETYPIKMTLQEMSQGRSRGKKRTVVSYSVDVDARKGIPCIYDHSGGWKGDRFYGFAVTVKNIGLEWELDAKNLIAAYVLDQRGKSGFRKALVED